MDLFFSSSTPGQHAAFFVQARGSTTALLGEGDSAAGWWQLGTRLCVRSRMSRLGQGHPTADGGFVEQLPRWPVPGWGLFRVTCRSGIAGLLLSYHPPSKSGWGFVWTPSTSDAFSGGCQYCSPKVLWMGTWEEGSLFPVIPFEGSTDFFIL